MDPGELEHRAHAAAGDHAGTGGGRLEQDAAGAEDALDWWVIVSPCLGTLKRFFLARSTPFWIASGTSLALP